MNYPINHPSHQKEYKSKNMLRSALDAVAIFREFSETDYGIDGVIDFKSGSNEMIGQEILVQLKSTENCSFRSGNFISSPQINISTINYWMGKKSPVLLILVDINTEKIYYVDIKPLIVLNYLKTNQQTMSFEIPTCNQLHKNNLSDFSSYCSRALQFDENKNAAVSLLRNFNVIYEYLIMNSGYDFHINLFNDDPRIRKLNEYYELVAQALTFYQLNYAFSSLEKIIHNQPLYGKIDYYEHHITVASCDLKNAIEFFLEKTIQEHIPLLYWQRNDSSIYDLIVTGRFIMEMISKREISHKNVSKLKLF